MTRVQLVKVMGLCTVCLVVLTVLWRAGLAPSNVAVPILTVLAIPLCI